ncbi:MAG TPA: glycosyltransferase family 2 protein, partial [Solirubrobacteraceae bacterium]|nr:glycosyltransferase family 2 protein [Solirubrobacteraceae bacterium]
PNWNGRRWLPGLLDSLAAQTEPPDEVVVVDNGSTDGSLDLLRDRGVRTIALGRNTGFAFAANRGVEAVSADAVALVNTDVELEPDWLARASAALADGVGSVATKMVLLDDPDVLDDAGDELRRDGVAHQRGHGRRDDGRFAVGGDVFSACAGAALYRRAALLDVGGFDERLFSYLEDVDLGLRLRLAGWRCVYEPVVARHARHGSSGQLTRSVDAWVARNTLLLVAKAFPLRWVGPVAYRQLSWIAEAAREGRLVAHLRGLAMALPVLPAMLRERRRLRREAVVPIEKVVPPIPWRGPAAGGHPEASY